MLKSYTSPLANKLEKLVVDCSAVCYQRNESLWGRTEIMWNASAHNETEISPPANANALHAFADTHTHTTQTKMHDIF